MTVQRLIKNKHKKKRFLLIAQLVVKPTPKELTIEA